MGRRRFNFDAKSTRELSKVGESSVAHRYIGVEKSFATGVLIDARSDSVNSSAKKVKGSGTAAAAISDLQTFIENATDAEYEMLRREVKQYEDTAETVFA